MTVPLIRTPEDTCCHCHAAIYFQGMWRHLPSLLSACDNGRTNAQPPDGSRWDPPAAAAALEGEVQAPGTVGTCRIAVWKAGGWYRWECTSTGHTGNGVHTTEARRDQGLADHARQVAAADAATWVTVDAEPCTATMPEHSGCVVFINEIPARCERRAHPPGTPHAALGLAWDGDDPLSLRKYGDCCPLHADGGCRAPDACCEACPDRTRP